MTTSLRWVDAFSLQMPPLDDAHRELFERVRTAIIALQDGQRNVAARAIDVLSEEARRHFDHEDVLMREIAYPGYYNHREQHRCLILGLERLQVALALRSLAVADAIQQLRSWFSLHLLNDDQALSTFISRRNA